MIGAAALDELADVEDNLLFIRRVADDAEDVLEEVDQEVGIKVTARRGEGGKECFRNALEEAG